MKPSAVYHNKGRSKALLAEDSCLWKKKTWRTQRTRLACEYETELRRRFDGLENKSKK